MNDNTQTLNPTPTNDDSAQDDQQVVSATIITKEQLNSIGINLPDEEMQALIRHTEDTINERISEEVIDSLDDQQIEELASMQESNAPADQIEAWVIERVPDYQEIVEDNTTIVLGELAESVEQISD
jgi:uncharacterized transporter YbjL